MSNEVAVSMKIFMDDQGKMEETLKEINKIVTVTNMKTEDVGFGIKALKIIFLMGDDGGVDQIEEKIAAVQNVSQVQVEEVSRL